MGDDNESTVGKKILEEVVRPLPSEYRRAPGVSFLIDNIEDYEKLVIMWDRSRIQNRLLSLFVVLVLVNMGIYLLQGFHLWNFNLPLPILRFLGVALVGKVVGMVGIVLKYYFK